ncbi:MAG: hypothetical protein LUD50_03520 [Clostridia bacterium]|nr:hypothetical protein [Clostridia bacterium]
MYKEAVIFHDADDLIALTGLSEDDLWNNGFNLDDFDGGIRVNEVLDDSTIEWLLENAMEDYCIGYALVEYCGYYYYMIHHA